MRNSPCSHGLREGAKFDGMPIPEFEKFMTECERLVTELKNCQDPTARRKLLKQMSVALDAATKVAFQPPPVKEALFRAISIV